MKSIIPFLSLYRTHWGRLLLGVILAITSLSASIGLLSLSGWFLAASFLAGSALVFNFFYPSSGVRGLAIGRTVSRYFERLVTHDATFRVLANLRVTIFKKLIPLSPSGLKRYRNSELLNRLVADVDTLDSLSFVSGLLAVIICGTLLALLAIFPTVFYHLGRKLGQNTVQSRAQYRAQFIEWIQLHAEFLLFGLVPEMTTKLQKTEEQWLEQQSKESHLTGLSNALLVFSNGILLCVVIYLISSAIHAPTADYPQALIALVIFCVMASTEILMPIGVAFLHLGQVIAAAERLNEITEQPAQVSFNGSATWQEVVLNQPLIEFDSVSFGYPMQSEMATKSISLSIKAGEKIAIVGKTGSGKSTLFQLLNRNYAPTSGRILLNHCEIADYPEAVLRQHLVTLSQRVHIFNASLKQNLLMGNPNASDAQLLEVLETVGLAYLSEEGLSLWLGEGGRPLSGGEQRRLGLARVLLSPAEVILLDEPTEGLDRETEQLILRLILSHCANKTLLMITHRLKGLSEFDRIYQIDNGQLVN